MKIKVSVSMEEDTLKQIKDRLKEGNFRNQSHFVEHAVTNALKEVDSK